MTVSTSSTGQAGYHVLGIYLNDHLAGATAGTELARRVARNHDDARLRRFAVDLVQDRAALAEMMKALGIPQRTYKVGAAWLGEKAGRLKLNGHLFTRSPLSDLEELEIMRLGVEGKAAGWRTLRALAAVDSRLDPDRLDDLLDRAHDQSELLEKLWVAAATQVIGTEQARTSH